MHQRIQVFSNPLLNLLHPMKKQVPWGQSRSSFLYLDRCPQLAPEHNPQASSKEVPSRQWESTKTQEYLSTAEPRTDKPHFLLPTNFFVRQDNLRERSALPDSGTPTGGTEPLSLALISSAHPYPQVQALQRLHLPSPPSTCHFFHSGQSNLCWHQAFV